MPYSKNSELDKLILIGASTGGPGHIQKILSALPTDFSTSIIIAQHIENQFVPSLVRQLDSICNLNVQQVKNHLILQHSQVYICNLVTHLSFSRQQFSFQQHELRAGQYNPDINQLFSSIARNINQCKIMAMILTGIGDDGVDGMKKLSAQGVRCIAESSQSAIVDGMPHQARTQIDNIEVLDLASIIEQIKRF